MPTRAVYLCTALVLVQILSNNFVAFAAKGKRTAKKPDSFAYVKADKKPIESLADLKDGVYSIALWGERSDCGFPATTKDQEFLGFNNRTCNPSLSAKSTSGPVMRKRSRSMLWRDWMVRVEEEQKDSKKVSLQAFVDPDVEDEARCLGYMSSFYNSPGYEWTCSMPPFGNGLFLNETKYAGKTQQENAQAWSVQPVEGRDDVFTIIASSKPKTCARALAVEDCDTLPHLVEFPDTNRARMYTSWQFIKRFDPVPSSPPPMGPPASPPPPPSPSTPTVIPGPIIAAPSFTSNGLVRVTISDVGGNEVCTVKSIVITYSGNTIDSKPQDKVVDATNPNLSSVGVELSLKVRGYNSVSAIGKCSNGDKTEMSNQVSVYNSMPGNKIVNGIIVEFDILYKINETFFDSLENKRQVCRNVLDLQPGGTCIVTSVVAGASRRLRSLLAASFTQVLGSVQYDKTAVGKELEAELKKSSQQTLSTLATGIVNSPSDVSVESTSTSPVAESKEPGPPGFVTASNINVTDVNIAWLDGKVGDPLETYTVNCVASASSSCSDKGIDVTGIPRGDETEFMTGLEANTTYSCWVIATNRAGTVCSQQPAIFRTLIEPDAPTSFDSGLTGSTSVAFTWQDGDAGNPVELYTIVCSTSTSASNCLNPGGTVVMKENILRGTEKGTISGLTASTAYKCWVKAGNSVGEICSNGQLISTTSELLSPQVVAYDQMASVTPGTYTPPGGATNLTYQAQCLSSSATVCDPQASGTGALHPSIGLPSPVPISVTGLDNNVLYQCFTVATYILDSQTKYACSGPVQVKPFTPPQALLTQNVLSGDEKLTIKPSQFTAPAEANNTAYQVQCLDVSATSCDPQASGTGALQPATAQQNVTPAITVPALTNDVVYQCFSVVTYTLNSQTQYTCSPAFPAIPAAPPTLQTGAVIAGFQQITITPDQYSLPTGTDNVTYQVQCFEGQTTECDPSSSLSPSPGLSSPGPIELSSLQDSSVYSCFSVVSYMINASERYTCSEQFKAYLPMSQPVNLTAQGVISQGSQMTIYADAYNNSQSQSDVKYQVQCLDSSATVCDPLATGTGALQPSTPSSSPGFNAVPSLTTNITYQCFSVVSFTHNVGFRYTCSDPFEVMAVEAPTLTTQKILASSGQLSITPDDYTGPSGGSTEGYQVQCFGSQSSFCDLINDSATPTTALKSPGAIIVSSLTNNAAQYCFSVVSYNINGATRYTCSSAFEAIPFAAPQAPTSSNVSPGNNTLTITPISYTAPTIGVASVQYQVQCLESNATICDPVATGTGALQPSTAQSGLAAITVSGLINAVNYKCFEVVTYIFNSNTKYTCSDGYTTMPQLPAVFDVPYGVANNGNTVFVTNTAGNSITVCDFDGSSLTNCAAASVSKSLKAPYGISIFFGSNSKYYAAIANQGTNEYYICTVSGRSFVSCNDLTVSSKPLNFLVAPSILTSNTVKAYVRENNLQYYGGSGTYPITGVRDADQYLQKAYLTIYSGSKIQQCDLQTVLSITSVTNCADKITGKQNPNAIVVDATSLYAYVSYTNGGNGSIMACAINASTGDMATSCTDVYSRYSDLNSIAIIGNKAIFAVGSLQTVPNQGVGYPVIVCTIDTNGPVFKDCIERI